MRAWRGRASVAAVVILVALTMSNDGSPASRPPDPTSDTRTGADRDPQAVPATTGRTGTVSLYPPRHSGFAYRVTTRLGLTPEDRGTPTEHLAELVPQSRGDGAAQRWLVTGSEGSRSELIWTADGVYRVRDQNAGVACRHEPAVLEYPRTLDGSLPVSSRWGSEGCSGTRRFLSIRRMSNGDEDSQLWLIRTETRYRLDPDGARAVVAESLWLASDIGVPVRILRESRSVDGSGVILHVTQKWVLDQGRRMG